MAVTELDTDYYTASQVAVRQAVEQAQAAWSQLDPAELVSSWQAAVAPRAVAAVERGQAQAASLAQPYVVAALVTAGVVAAPLAVVAGAFAGLAAAGLPLHQLLDYALIAVLRALALGVPLSQARARGLAKLLTYTATEVTDAGRAAVHTAMLANPQVAGYERVVHLPACGRCILLAGRLYRYSQGFARHPRCDCTMKPVTRAQWGRDRPDNHPQALFARMSRAQQDKAFGKGDAAALRAGADMSRVVNSRRKDNLYVAGGREFTREATTVRGVGRQLGQLTRQAGDRYRSSQVARPTAAQLVANARASQASRAELVEQLRRYGYLR